MLGQGPSIAFSGTHGVCQLILTSLIASLILLTVQAVWFGLHVMIAGTVLVVSVDGRGANALRRLLVMSVDLVVLLPFLLLVECLVDAFFHFVVFPVHILLLIILILLAQIESVSLLPTGHSFGLIVLHFLRFFLVEAILLVCVNISYSQKKQPLLVVCRCMLRATTYLPLASFSPL